jgi:hypothetical protein
LMEIPTGMPASCIDGGRHGRKLCAFRLEQFCDRWTVDRLPASRRLI